jgi:hypothetical protein
MAVSSTLSTSADVLPVTKNEDRLARKWVKLAVICVVCPAALDSGGFLVSEGGKQTVVSPFLPRLAQGGQGGGVAARFRGSVAPMKTSA